MPRRSSVKKSKTAADAAVAAEQNRFEEEFYVEEIVDSRVGPGGVTEYLVKWLGYDESENSWVDEADMNDGPLLEAFRQKTAAPATVMDEDEQAADQDHDEEKKEKDQQQKSRGAEVSSSSSSSATAAASSSSSSSSCATTSPVPLCRWAFVQPLLVAFLDFKDSEHVSFTCRHWRQVITELSASFWFGCRLAGYRYLHRKDEEEREELMALLYPRRKKKRRGGGMGHAPWMTYAPPDKSLLDYYVRTVCRGGGKLFAQNRAIATARLSWSASRNFGPFNLELIGDADYKALDRSASPEVASKAMTCAEMHRVEKEQLSIPGKLRACLPADLAYFHSCVPVERVSHSDYHLFTLREAVACTQFWSCRGRVEIAGRADLGPTNAELLRTAELQRQRAMMQDPSATSSKLPPSAMRFDGTGFSWPFGFEDAAYVDWDLMLPFITALKVHPSWLIIGYRVGYKSALHVFFTHIGLRHHGAVWAMSMNAAGKGRFADPAELMHYGNMGEHDSSDDRSHLELLKQTHQHTHPHWFPRYISTDSIRSLSAHVARNYTDFLHKLHVDEDLNLMVRDGWMDD